MSEKEYKKAKRILLVIDSETYDYLYQLKKKHGGSWEDLLIKPLFEKNESG